MLILSIKWEGNNITWPDNSKRVGPFEFGGQTVAASPR